MKYFFRLLIFVTLTLTMSSCGVIWTIYEHQQNYLAPQHFPEDNSEYEVIWNLSDVQAPTIAGSPNRIIVEGSIKGEVFDSTILGIDSTSGDILWKRSGSVSESIIAHGSVLYRGTIGTAVVHAHNVENGELLWSTLLPGAHSTSNLYFAENKIFVHTNDSEFFVLNEQGEILDHFHETFDTFLELDGILYMQGNYSINAVDYFSKEELWQLDVGEHFDDPVFDDGEIFLRTWTVPTKIYSVDQYIGKSNWVLSQDVQSNLCLIGDKLYFTTPDGYLVAVNRYSSQENSRVKFSPPFDLDKQVGGYYVACDPANNVLAVSFGDNTQVTGLRVINP